MEHTVFWPGWETVRLIGRGSFGAVYEIQRTLFGEVEKAALKVITIPQNAGDIEIMRSEGFDEESITNAFRDHLKNIVSEYSFMRKMNGSANIVNCDDVRYVQHDDGIGWDIYIKMELLTPLTKALPDAIPEETVIKIAMDLCSALELCKKYDIVHRDIKPQNIFVSDNGDYKLGDFGIAKTVEKTMSGTKIGTYKYMAPEVYHSQPYGSAADIYSLGLVLYWMLNERRMPFLPLPPAKLSARMDEDARTRRLTGEPIPPPKNGSEELKRIVLKACAYDPKERYTDAGEMRESLSHLIDGASLHSIAARTSQTTGLGATTAELSSEDTMVRDENYQKRNTSSSQVPAAALVSSKEGEIPHTVSRSPQGSRGRSRFLVITACLLTGFFLIGSLLLYISIQKIKAEKQAQAQLQEKYAAAEKFYESGEYDQAADAFEALGSYRDSREQAKNARLADEKQNRAQQTDDATTPGNTGSGTFSSTDVENVQTSTETEETVTTEPPHVHSWVEATCITPKTCYTCGEISGSALGHQWTAATCTTPRTCSLCGETSGSALGHQWTAATCTSPRTCSLCGETSGSALGHQWTAATCTAPRTCSLCGEISGNALGHQWTAATCTAPRTCSLCGETSGSALGHQWTAATCTTPISCSLCGATTGSALGHQWKEATYNAPKTCRLCGKTEGSPLTDPLSQLSVGDIFVYGTYEQDNNFANGAEGIEWVVLEKWSDKILVISRYALDCQRYHRQDEAVTWANCSVRTWLNSTFYNASFNNDEKDRILDTTDANTYATDKVFLLSIDELNRYYYSNSDRTCRATSYAISQNAHVDSSTGGSWWLLRTPGASNQYVMSVNSDGRIDYDGGRVASDRGTVRPAMWIATSGGASTVSGMTDQSDSEKSPKLSTPESGMIAAGNYHSVHLFPDGTVNAAGRDTLSQYANTGTRRDVYSWTDIVAISASSHTVGLKADGTVVACGVNRYGQCNLSDWKDIIAISAGDNHTVGLRSDGTVVAKGKNDFGQCDVSSWRNIVSIAACGETTFGLQSDGRIVYAGEKNYGISWRDIVSICGGTFDLVGLKKDGTVVAAGSCQTWGTNAIDTWTNIVAISASSTHIVGLRADGTVVACGSKQAIEACAVDSWTDIVDVSAGMYFTIGLKSDGSIVSVGSNTFNQCDIW